MNKHLLKYMAEDSWQGLKRNPGSTIASVFLMALALLLIGFLLSVRLFAADAVEYIESQLSMKVYVSESVEAEAVAAVLLDKRFVADAAVEYADDTIDGLAFFFSGKEHLLEAFREGGMLDAVKLEITDKSMMDRVAADLSSIEGIAEVVYPQQMAVTLDAWVTKFEQYGTAAALLLFAVAFLMVYVTFRLSLYKRQEELTVKLFVGMDPRAVRGQFLLEGALLGLFGSALAMALTAAFQLYVLKPVQQALPFAGQLHGNEIVGVLALQLVIGVALGIAASYLSTRRGIADG